MADHLGAQNAVHRGLTRRKIVLFVGLLVLIGASGLLSFAAVNGLVKFPFVATAPNITNTAGTTKTGVMDGFDPAHTNWNPYEKVLNATNVPHLVPLRVYPTYAALQGSRAAENGEASISDRPAFANGIIYVGSMDHNFYAFDASCRSACQPLWSYATDGPIGSSPTVANGIIYVGSDDHMLYAFDTSCRSACQPLWSYTTAEYISSSPAVANGIVYIASLGNETPDAHVPVVGRLYAFDASCRRNCQPLWSRTGSETCRLFSEDTRPCQHTGSYYPYSSPMVANGILYAGSQDGKLYGFGVTVK